jgi:hypothetical protein
MTGLDADGLIAVADRCVESLRPLGDRDWSTAEANTTWSCREVLAHLAQLSYAPILASRAEAWLDLKCEIPDGASVDWLLVAAHANAVTIAEVARAAPATARAFHPCGMADPAGFIAMTATEFVLHTTDVAAALDAPFRLDDGLTRVLLDRLFPWWPTDEDPWAALQWASGRGGSLGGRASLGDRWAWHCAPVEEWDGAVPEWDPVTSTKVTH